MPGACGCTQANAQLAVVRESHERTGREVRGTSPATAGLLHSLRCCLSAPSHQQHAPSAVVLLKPSAHAHLCISLALHVQAEAAHARVQTLRQQVAELERQVDQEREARAEVDSELEVGDGIQGLGSPRV